MRSHGSSARVAYIGLRGGCDTAAKGNFAFCISQAVAVRDAGRVAPRPRAGYSAGTARGAAVATNWTFRGVRVATRSRPRAGYFAGTGRAAAASWIFRGGGSRRRRRRHVPEARAGPTIPRAATHILGTGAGARVRAAAAQQKDREVLRRERRRLRRIRGRSSARAGWRACACRSPWSRRGRTCAGGQTRRDEDRFR